MIDADEHRFQSRFGAAETERRLTAFFQAQALDPHGEFRGVVSEGWLKARARRFRLFGFDYRGAISETNGVCWVEMLVTPTPLTMIALLVIAVPVFLGFVFAIMALTFGFGPVEGGSGARALQLAIMALLAGAIALALIEPVKTRRRLVRRLREVGIALRPDSS